LIAPLNSNADQWNKIKYVDAHTGKVYGLHNRHKERRVNGTVQDDSEIPMPQLYGNVLYASRTIAKPNLLAGTA
jgi:predicted secreted acid phosphatase